MDRGPGIEFGRYRMLAEPVYYGAGSLVDAVETATGQLRTLWLLMPHIVNDAAVRAKILAIAQVLRRLRSDHLARLHEIGEVGGQPFFALGAGDGLDLAELSAPAGFRPTDALDIVAQVGKGVDCLHHAGLVDGALGPRRVQVTEVDGEIRAVVRDAALLAVLLPTSALFGSQKQEALDFGAPELHRGQAATVRSDIYALGGLLWFALTGLAPFASYPEHLSGAVPQVAGEGPVEEAINAVLRRSMAKEPDARYADAGSFVGTLRAIAALARQEQPGVVPDRLVPLDAAAVRAGTLDAGTAADLPADHPEDLAVEPPVALLSAGAGSDADVAGVAPAALSTLPSFAPVLPAEDEVEPALRTAIDHWDASRRVSVRRRRSGGTGARVAVVAVAVVGLALAGSVWGSRQLGPTGGSMAEPAPAPGTTTVATATPAQDGLAQLFPIREKGDCVEAEVEVEHLVERWTCERRGYRVVLSRWDRASRAAELTAHGGPAGFREPWLLHDARAGTQWTWRAAGGRLRYRWTGVYADIPYAVVIEARNADRRRYARHNVVIHPSTALG